MATISIAAGNTPDKDLGWIDVTRNGICYKKAISPIMMRAARGVMDAYNDDIKAGRFTGVAQEVVAAWRPTLGRKGGATARAPIMGER